MIFLFLRNVFRLCSLPSLDIVLSYTLFFLFIFACSDYFCVSIVRSKMFYTNYGNGRKQQKYTKTDAYQTGVAHEPWISRITGKRFCNLPWRCRRWHNYHLNEKETLATKLMHHIIWYYNFCFVFVSSNNIECFVGTRTMNHFSFLSFFL